MARNFKKIRPSLGRIAIKLLETDELTAGGLWLPGGRQTLANVGEVIAVCDRYKAAADDDDAEYAPEGPMYQVGDIVVIGKYQGVEVEIGDSSRDRQEVIIINESDVLCTLEEG